VCSSWLWATQRPSGEIRGFRPSGRTPLGEPSTFPIKSVYFCGSLPKASSIDQTSEGRAVEPVIRPELVLGHVTAARRITHQHGATILIGDRICN
jgi:hypothetical protein